MSALGQKRTFAPQKVMSALLLKADMCAATRDVRFGPIADMLDPLAGAGLHQRNGNLLKLFFSVRPHYLDCERILADIVRRRTIERDKRRDVCTKTLLEICRLQTAPRYGDLSVRWRRNQTDDWQGPGCAIGLDSTEEPYVYVGVGFALELPFDRWCLTECGWRHRQQNADRQETQPFQANSRARMLGIRAVAEYRVRLAWIIYVCFQGHSGHCPAKCPLAAQSGHVRCN
jgi:hypothetical protein